MNILTLLKNYKGIASVIGILAALGSLYAVYDTVRDDWYEQGVADTQRAYEAKIIGLQQEYNVRLEQELASFREETNRKHAAEIARIQAEKEVEIETVEVIEYVDREIEVPVECDIVPVDFSRVLNETIRKVNGGSTTFD